MSQSQHGMAGIDLIYMQEGSWLCIMTLSKSVTAFHGRDRPYIYAGGVIVMHHDPL